MKKDRQVVLPAKPTASEVIYLSMTGRFQKVINFAWMWDTSIGVEIDDPHIFR